MACPVTRAVFPARYPGNCAWCGNPFQAGTPIVTWDQPKHWYMTVDCARWATRTRLSAKRIRAALPTTSNAVKAGSAPGR